VDRLKMSIEHSKKPFRINIDEKTSTSDLEKSGALVDLSLIDIDENPKSPYGKSIDTGISVYGGYKVVFETFELCDIITVWYDNNLLSRTVRKKGNA